MRFTFYLENNIVMYLIYFINCNEKKDIATHTKKKQQHKSIRMKIKEEKTK